MRLILMMTLAVAAVAMQQSSKQEAPVVVVPQLPPKEQLTPLEAKLDRSLREIVRAGKTSKEAAIKAAGDQAIPLDKDQVAVSVTAKSRRDLGGLKRRMKREGGAVTTTFQQTLYGTLPVDKIESFATHARVVKVSADLPNEIKKRENPSKK